MRYRRVLLVDDVFTTGATFSECADTLLRAGARSVHVAGAGARRRVTTAQGRGHIRGAAGTTRAVAKPPAAEEEETKVLARNRKARHVYHIDETLEAGIVLVGSEVKSIRDGKVTMVDAFAEIDKNEAWLHQVDISVYAHAHGRNHEPRRRRKLLLHRREIDRLAGKIREKGYTLVPLSLYEKKGRVKAELALVHGKQEWDKRRGLEEA